MPKPLKENLLSEAEENLKGRYSKEEASLRRVPSSAHDPAQSRRVDQLALPADMRPKMPMTKDKFLVKENPHLVAWERLVREFLRNLSPKHGHRVAAVMVYEWATGISLAELQKEGGSANQDLRKINEVLKWYFGDPYMTYIAGRKVPRAYRVKPGYFIRRHRPYTVTLYAEYLNKTLYP